MDSIEKFKKEECIKCIHNEDVSFNDCYIVTNVKGYKQCIYLKEKEKSNNGI